MSFPTLLSQLRERIVVDVDSMDPDVAARHSKTGRFCDMTSNQGIVYAEASRPERLHLVKESCQRAKAAASTQDVEEQVTLALDIMTVLLAKEIFPFLDRHVHVQTSPSTAYDTQKTIQHATRLVAHFEALGIPKSRVCIKIPATPESILACCELQKRGYKTLATCLFSLPQALAASQAGCVYVAPYFNELRVHIDPMTWKEYRNTVEEHPMISVIASILKAYKEIGSSTLVMPASIVSPNEILALAALYPQHLTISSKILDQLSVVTTTQLHSVTYSASGASPENIYLKTNFLAEGAAALKTAFEKDGESARKMKDALQIFDDAEQQTKNLIRRELALI